MNTDIDERNRKHFKKMEEGILPHRAVLRGALAFDCGLLPPPALFGFDSMKDANSTGAAPPVSPATSAEYAAPSPKTNSFEINLHSLCQY